MQQKIEIKIKRIKNKIAQSVDDRSTSAFLRRQILSIQLYSYLFLRAFFRLLLLLFAPSGNSFMIFNSIDKKHGYTTSFTSFKRIKHIAQTTNVLLVCSIITVSALALDYAGQIIPSWAASCSISGDTTVDSTYITTNSCDNITVTANAVVTFTEAINLGGAGDYTFTVNSGVTATFSGAFNLSDSGDALQIDGTVTHANDSATGVDITAGIVNVSGTGSINTNAKGCQGVVTSSAHGYGPNGSNVCTVSTAGYATGATGTTGRGGAGHGGAGGAGNSTAGGITYGSATAPILQGSSAGNVSGIRGGFGGGYIKLNVSTTLTVNGSITGNGGNGNTNGSTQSSGGGSGGSIYITTATFDGTPTISATGGNGGNGSTNDGGGAGGGRVSVSYTGGTFTPSSSLFTVTGGSGPDAAEDGAKGTVYVKNTSTSVVNIYHGFTYDDTDHNVTTWTIDSSATNQYCATSTATPSITATNLTIAGTLSCDISSITSFNLSGSSAFTITSSTVWSVNAVNADMDWNFPASSSNTWTSSTITGGAEGAFTINDAITLTLNSTTINANANWTGLTNITIDASSTVSGNSKGCTGSGTSAANGYGPDGSNVCTVTTAGYSTGAGTASGRGGAGHGGVGGAGNTTAGGTTYGTATAPVLFGSSAGNVSTTRGGTGGGYIRFDVTGTLTVNGTVAANGGAGPTNGSNQSNGGGSGGSIYITTATFDGTPIINAVGGDGGNGSTNDGGGGGAGRVAITYTGGTFTPTSSIFTLNGGVGPDSAEDGAKGTVYVKNTSTSVVNIYHGFTYDDTDYNVTTWTIDASATNQYCATSSATPSITATNLTIAGTLSCDISSITSFNLSAISALSVVSGTIWSVNAVNADMDWNIPTAANVTWSNATITGGAEGAFTINDNVSITLSSSTINANAQWTGLANLTIDGSSSINTNSKGCQGVATSGADGYGPDGTNVCATATAGYSSGSGTASGRGGAGHGGIGGTGNTSAGGANNDSATAPVLFGSSAGNVVTQRGGLGGGYIRLDVSNTLTLNGSLSANASNGATNGTTQASGGGAGGSIYVSTATFNGTPTISATGGDGANGSTNDGGGGSGGRIAITYTGGTLSPASGLFTMTGGSGPDTAEDGPKGTVYVKNTSTNVVNIYHGFTYDDTDHSVTTWNIDSSATGQNCAPSAATPSVTATNLTIGGTLACDISTITSFNLSASSSFTARDSTVWSVNNTNADIDWDIPDGSYTWTSVGVTVGAEGAFTIDDAATINLVSTQIKANVNWTNLSGLSIDASSYISASSRGCQGVTTTNIDGYGPNGSNVCTISTAGATADASLATGGAGHGGAGGNASNGTAGGTTYGSATAPVLFGSSAGNAGVFKGGVSGGYIRLDISSGTLTINGSVLADGGAGATNGSTVSTGGGSGGSIYITTGTLSGSPTISADGGIGADGSTNDGGEGGGGRVSLGYGTDSSGWTATATAANTATGANGPGAGAAASDGTLNLTQFTAPSTPSITSPTASATNQSRSITATSSAYSANGATHTTSDWQISDNNTFSDGDCSDTNIVFCSLDSSNKESIAVNTTNGTFQNGLNGKTLLAPSTTYYVRVRHTNAVGDSTWSSAIAFTTQSNTAPNTPTNATPTDAAVDVSKNPTLTASAFADSDSDAHGTSDWLVYESSTCSGTADWSAASSSNLTSVVVNSTNGTFADSLASQTTLKSHTTYSFKVRYTDSYSSSSSYSTCTSFTTLNTTPVFSGTISDQTFLEDQSTGLTSVFDLDDYFSDSDFNDNDQYTCTATNDLSAGLGTITINGNQTITFSLVGNANGSDTIQFSCQDSQGASATTNVITVTVTAVNDTPSFTKGGNPSILEDAGAQTVTGWATSMSAGPSDESSQTLSFTVANDNNALFSVQPAVASNGNLTYTPAANANGSATVTMSISDNGGTANSGDDTSNDQTFTITVTGVNDTPSFTKGGNPSILEDAGAQTVTGWATSISKGPSDESSQTVSFNVANDNNALFSSQPAVASNGNLTYTPAANANGSATVTMSISDNGGTANSGDDTSDDQTFTITVIAVNDTPSFTKGANQSVLENAGAQTVTGWATSISKGPSDESSQTVSFNIANDNSTLFSVQPAVASNGTLTFTPSGTATGSATVTISISDSGGTTNGGDNTSDDQTFTISILDVNTAPSFTKGANQTVLEDAGLEIVPGWATDIEAGSSPDESGQTLSFNVTNDNNSLFLIQPVVSSGGNLIYMLASNANGSATVTLSLSDDGGTDNGGDDESDDQTFTITATAVNDAPSFTKGANQSVAEDASAQTVTGWATSISAGPSDESGQAVSFNVTNDNNSLFSSQPAVASNGNLTYTPAANANGSATVTISISDNGGTTNGGDNTSDDQTFTITVTAGNDTPVANAGTNQSANEDDETVTVDGSASSDIDTGDVLTFEWVEILDPSDGCSLTNPENETPSVNLANKDSNYSCEYRLTVNDGTIDSSPDTVVINVTADNDAPTITNVTDKTVSEQDALNFAVAASDPDTAQVALSIEDSESDFSAASIDVDTLFTDNENNTGTFSWTPTYTQQGSYIATVQADDGDATATDIVNITVQNVNTTPEFTENLPASIAFTAGTTTLPLFDLNEYVSDEDGDDLSFSVAGNNKVAIGIENGVVTMSAPASFSGSETVRFTVSDPQSAQATSNAVLVSVDAASSGGAHRNIDHIEGSPAGEPGVVTVIGRDGDVLASWTAFATGGAIAKYTWVNNTAYIFVMKRTPGKYIKVYTGSGRYLTRKKVSPNIHWRKIAVGQIDNTRQTIEVVLGTTRSSKTVYLKLYQFNTRTRSFRLIKRQEYAPQKKRNYQIDIMRKIIVLRKQNKPFLLWKPKKLQ